jgi:hypothetical protein
MAASLIPESFNDLSSKWMMLFVAKCRDKCDGRNTPPCFEMIGRGCCGGTILCEEYLGFSFCRI